MHNALVIVLSSPSSPEVEQDYNDWYNSHLEEILTLPHVLGTRRYAVLPNSELYPETNGVGQSYVAIFELDTDTPEAIAEFGAALRAAIGNRDIRVSRSMSMDDLTFVFAQPTGPDLRA